MLAKHSAFARKAGSVLALVACLSGGHLAVGQDTRLFRADGFNPGANDEVRAVAVQADGKVLIGGSFSQLSPNGSGSVGRNCIARLNRDGTVDVAFNPNANGRVRAIAVQPDGNILIGGEFTTLSPNFGSAVTRNRIARLKPDGTIDPTFDPSANGSVQAIALQPDGKILIAGDFTTLAPASAAPATRNRIARLLANGTLDGGFNPNADGSVRSLVLQADGNILAGGSFTAIGGQPRNRLARLSSNGSADSFNPAANGSVNQVALQPDGKILVAGIFTSIGGQQRKFLARLHPTSGLADSFNPNPTDQVTAIAVQPNGKILVGGFFRELNFDPSIGGQPRDHIARLDPVTGLADSLDLDANQLVNVIVVQPDGKILAGGFFSSIGQRARLHIARIDPHFDLSSGNLIQDWSDPGLLTTDDKWDVPGLVGYRGDGLVSGIGTDPQAIAEESTVVDLNANRTDPNSDSTGGVAEFALQNPTVALQASDIADAPHLQLNVSTLGLQDIRVSYVLRDIDGSSDNALQKVALQYRVGELNEPFNNVPEAFVSDATTGPGAATKETPVHLRFPSSFLRDVAQLQLRIITSNAAGNDEWVGIDDICVSGRQTLSPDRSTNAGPLPLNIVRTNSPNGQYAIFRNVPAAATSLSVSVDVTHPNPSQLKVFVYPGVPDPQRPGRPPVTAPIAMIWDHQKFLDPQDPSQPKRNLQTTMVLPQTIDGVPFLGSDTYTVQVMDDTYPRFVGVTGVFNSASLTVNPRDCGAGPPVVSLYGASPAQPVPTRIDYPEDLTLGATATPVSSASEVARLAIAIRGPSSPFSTALPTNLSSHEIAQGPSSEGAALSYTPPGLPPGFYEIQATAIDDSGFVSQTEVKQLQVRRVFGLMSFSYTSYAVGSDGLLSFSGKMSLQNDTPTGSGALRVRLVEVATANFRDDAGPPDLSGYPPATPLETTIGSVSPLAPGTSQEVAISAKVRSTIKLDPEGRQWVNFHVYAILDQDVGGTWVPVDSRKLAEGVKGKAFDFGGPGGGVNDPPSNLSGTQQDPYVLSSLSVRGPGSVSPAATPPPCIATVGYRNSVQTVTKDLAPDPRLKWSVSDPSAATIDADGVLHPAHIPSDRAIQVQAEFTFGGRTRSASLPVTVLASQPPPPPPPPPPTPPPPTPTITPSPTPTASVTPPSVVPSPASRLANISTRLLVETGDDVLIAGFIVTGSQPKKLLVRAIGPSLSLAGKLANPVLELYGQDGLIAQNDNWADAANANEIIDSTIPPTDGLEAAVVVTLPANGNAYTAVIQGLNGGTGIGSVEVYDLDATADSTLANISSRGRVQTGDDVMIAGFIVTGTERKRILVRAVGPSLPVNGKLANPTLEIHGPDGLITSNDNWVDAANKQEIIDTTVAPTNDLESAVVLTLPANAANYTAIVRGVGDTTGVASVEVYSLD